MNGYKWIMGSIYGKAFCQDLWVKTNGFPRVFPIHSARTLRASTAAYLMELLARLSDKVGTLPRYEWPNEFVPKVEIG